MCFDRSEERRRRARAFSLVELMVVLIIIGLLAGMVTINARGYLMNARKHTAKQEIATIVKALNTFYATYSRYPTNEEGLAILTKPSEKIPESLLDGKLTDPWGHDYQYNCPGSKSAFEVISYGADGREGGDGANADISSDNLKD
jgi:general secretion pathway protein G